MTRYQHTFQHLWNDFREMAASKDYHRTRQYCIWRNLPSFLVFIFSPFGISILFYKISNLNIIASLYRFQYSALNYNCRIRLCRIFLGMKLILIVTLHECKVHVQAHVWCYYTKSSNKNFCVKILSTTWVALMSITLNFHVLPAVYWTTPMAVAQYGVLYFIFTK